MKVAILKYNAGNVFSVLHALKRIGVEAVVTDDPATLRSADRVIFPGVGEASTAMGYLREHSLDALIKSLTQPVLGICIGMQLLCRHSEEGDTDCLGIFDVPVCRFNHASAPEMKIPHMGWNSLDITPGAKLFKGIEKNPYVYFVHSYYLKAKRREDVAATTWYSTTIDASVESGNVFACQFHPEKSGSTGLQILKNFTEL